MATGASAEVRQLVMDHQNVVVRDAKTGEDLTRSILLQIILEEEAGGAPMFTEAVRSLHAGRSHFGPQASRALAEQVQHPERGGADPYGSLTAREREVLHLIAEGLTTKEIARKLDISVKTAENHRGRVLDKLDVRNTAELVRYALRKGLLD